jgi:hypothetical protein
VSVLRNDVTWEERRAWAREQAKARLAAWKWPAPSPPADETREETAAIADAIRRGLYAGRPIQAARAQARLRELGG